MDFVHARGVTITLSDGPTFEDLLPSLAVPSPFSAGILLLKEQAKSWENGWFQRTMGSNVQWPRERKNRHPFLVG